MNNTREKLIEMNKVLCNSLHCNYDEFQCAMTIDTLKTAENLIANGVTVQEWIPVTERLPKNDTYILAITDGVVVSAYWHNDRFYAVTAIGVATVGCVTHWMPLPQPPKGE